MTGAMLRRHLLAAAVSLSVNAGLAALFLVLNGMSTAHAPAETNTVTAVDYVAPPPKSTRPRPRPPERRAVKQAPPPRIPNLASAIQAPELLQRGEGEDFTALLADEMSTSAGLILSEDQVDRAPQPTTKPPPRYPARALDGEIEGWVDLALEIDEGGAVRSVEVAAAEPAGIFEEAAAAAVWQWRYQPAIFRGRPVRCRMQQRVLFKLR